MSPRANLFVLIACGAALLHLSQIIQHAAIEAHRLPPDFIAATFSVFQFLISSLILFAVDDLRRKRP